MKPKPRHLEVEYASQWQDLSMATAYRHRQPYPVSVFDLLKRMARPGPVLEIGAGSGDATFALAKRFARVDAVEPSAAMISAAPGAVANIRWINATIEEAKLAPPYGLAVAAESLHWTNWAQSLPAIARALDTDAVLALLYRVEMPAVWSRELGQVIGRFSTNREFRPYSFVDELLERGLFRVEGALCTMRESCAQSPHEYVESLHSRNGLSRQRMSGESAAAFDKAVHELVRPHLEHGQLTLTHFAQLTWGTPAP